jgi:hypothetical protein
MERKSKMSYEYYVDPKGKDVSFERWRCCVYYHPYYATTKLFNHEEDYRAFLNSYPGEKTYQNFKDLFKDPLLPEFSRELNERDLEIKKYFETHFVD